MKRVIDDQRGIGCCGVTDPDPQHLIFFDQWKRFDSRLRRNERLVGYLHAAAVTVEHQSVIVAADTVCDHRAQAQRCAAMCAAVN